MDADLPTIDLQLWRADAIVLRDWLMTVDLDAVPTAHRAERQALVDLLARLEETDVRAVTTSEIERARLAVARDMGW